MESQIKQLLNVAENLIPELVRAYNVDVERHNSMVEDLDMLEEVVAERNEQISQLFDTVKKQADVIREQRKKLDEITNDAKRLAESANQKIGLYEAQIATLSAENRELKKQDVKKLVKTNKEQKAKLAERAKTVHRLNGELRNERRLVQGLRNQLEEQKIGFWQQGQERVIPYLNGDVIQRKDLTADTNVEVAAWWQHECGLKILCAYDAESDELYMCDPSNENGNMHTPSAVAEKVMLKYFRKLHKGKK